MTAIHPRPAAAPQVPGVRGTPVDPHRWPDVAAPPRASRLRRATAAA
ncbi:SAM-dependent methyltransferase, partial [Streptomyces coelicoflavus]|nr:SAM-dependent methyltransferase [Streptomyces coelicoflavus]